VARPCPCGPPERWPGGRQYRDIDGFTVRLRAGPISA